MYNPWRDLGKLSREIWILAVATLVNRAGTMVLPFLALYFTRGLEFTAERAGLALSVFGLGSLIAAPVAGGLCDRLGAFRVLVVSLSVSGLLLLVFPQFKDFGWIVAVTVVWAFVGEAFRPANLAILTEFSAPETRKASYALNRLATNLGMSVGPAVGGFLATVSFPALFYLDGATSLLAVVLLVLAFPKGASRRAPPPPPVTAGEDQPAGPRSGIGRFVFYLVGLLPVSIVFFQLHSAWPLYVVQHLGLPESAFGLLFTVNTALIILVEIPLNTATARWPHRWSLPLGAALTGFGFGAVLLAKGFWSAAATVVVWTFGEMILFPASAAFAADLAPPGRRGRFMGGYVMVFSLAMMVGPGAGTYVMERFGAGTLWSLAFLACLLSAVLLFAASRCPLVRPEGTDL